MRKGTTRWSGLWVIAVALMAVGVASGSFAGSGNVSPTPFGTPTAGIPHICAKISPPCAADWLVDWTEQTRSQVLARHGWVATSQPLAAQELAWMILEDVGNAVDAAVATAAMLGRRRAAIARALAATCSPMDDSAKNHRLYGLYGAGSAPASDTLVGLRQVRGLNSTNLGERLRSARQCLAPSMAGAGSSSASGACRWSQVLQPSIDTASQGFGLTERIWGDWESYDNFYVRHAQEGSRSPARSSCATGMYRRSTASSGPSTWRRPISSWPRTGPKVVYRGPIAERHRRSHERRRRRRDNVPTLSSFQSERVNPISTNYHGYDVYEMPPQRRASPRSRC